MLPDVSDVIPESDEHKERLNDIENARRMSKSSIAKIMLIAGEFLPEEDLRKLEAEKLFPFWAKLFPDVLEFVAGVGHS